MSKRNIALLALETEEEIPTIQEELCDPISKDEVEDLGIALQEIDEITEATDDATDTIGTMSRVSEVVSAVSAEQPLDPVALEMLKITYGDLCNRMGFKQTSVSLESHTELTREIALESILDTVKKAAKYIYELLLKAWEFAKSFFTSFFDKVKKLEKYATALKAKAQALTETKEQVEIPQGSYSTYLRHDNKLLTAESIATGIPKYFKAMENVFNTELGESKFKNVSDLMNAMMVKIDDERAVNIYVDKLIDLMPTFKKSSNQTNLSVGQERGEEQLPLGDVSMYSVRRIVKLQSGKDYGAEIHKVYFDKSPKYQKIKPEETHDRIYADEVIKLCDSVIEHCGKYKNIDFMSKQFNSLISEARKSIEVTDHKTYYVILGAALSKLFVNIYVKFATRLKQYDLQVCNAVLQYGNVCLNTLKSKVSEVLEPSGFNAKPGVPQLT